MFFLRAIRNLLDVPTCAAFACSVRKAESLSLRQSAPVQPGTLTPHHKATRASIACKKLQDIKWSAQDELH